MRVRRRLSLFGHRTLPLGPRRTFLQCARCGRTFSARALANGAASEDEKAVQALVAAVVMADSRIRPREMDAARRVLEQHGGLPLQPNDLADELHRLRRTIPEPLHYLVGVAPLLADAGKLRIVQAVYQVCAADDELHPAETRFIRAVGETLDLSPMRVREAMRSARQDR
ncbi:MAG TPA: TerB family tellurite resistance protein [Longimicrobiales bacterium]|nr:TerB family tellurite resistance protein [Longimicrobiales bacterium]